MLRNTAGGECDTRFVAADVFFNPFVFSTPPSFGHLPYILRCKTQGRSVIHVFLYSSMCFLYNNIKHSHLLPLYCCVIRQGESVILGLLLSLFFNPFALRALPLYFAAQNTEGECDTRFVAADVFSTPPSLCDTSPIFC